MPPNIEKFLKMLSKYQKHAFDGGWHAGIGQLGMAKESADKLNKLQAELIEFVVKEMSK